MRVFLYSHEAYQYTAWSIQADLAAKGHELFVFLETTPKQNPTEKIHAADYLLVIAPPAAFAETYAPSNATGRLIRIAIAQKLPIVPLLFSDENMDSPHYKRFIHESIAGIREFEAFRLNFSDWGGTIDSLNQRLIQTSPNRSGDFVSSELPAYDKKAFARGRKAEAIFEEGNRYYLDKKYAKAKDCFDEALGLKPIWYSAYNHRALARRRLNEIEGGMADINEAIRLKPDEADVWANRSIFYTDAENYQAAIDDANQAIKLNPELAAAYNNRAVGESSLGLYREALASYKQSLELDRRSSVTFTNRGITYDDFDMPDEALKDFDTAIALDKDNGEAYRSRAIWYMDRQKTKEALADYEKAIELLDSDEALSRAYNDRGILYDSIHQYGRAIPDFNKAIELDSKHLKAYCNRGNSYKSLEKYEQAMENYTQALAINPAYAYAYFCRANLHAAMLSFDKAMADIQQSIELDNTDWNAYHTRGILFHQKQSFQAAIEDFSKAIELKSHSYTYLMRGYCYLSRGMLDYAETDFENSLELEPGRKEAQKALEYVQRLLDKEDEPGCWGLLTGEKRKNS